MSLEYIQFPVKYTDWAFLTLQANFRTIKKKSPSVRLVLLPCLLGFVVGSTPIAYLLVRWRNRLDLRGAGSGNIGALNSYQVSKSWWIGLLVLILDTGKGVLAVQGALWVFGADLVPQSSAGIGAILGHMFPFWLRGHGGRGLATATGVALMIAPLLVVLWCACWLPGFLLFRDVNVGSAFACLFSMLCLLILSGNLSLGVNFHPEIRTLGFVLYVLLLIRLVEPVITYYHMHARRRT